MKKPVKIPIISRTVEKKYHLWIYDIVSVVTDAHKQLRGLVMDSKGKGRYGVVAYDEIPSEATKFGIVPARISEKTLTALRFVKEEYKGATYYMFHDMTGAVSAGIYIAKWEKEHTTFHLVVGKKFRELFREYIGSSDDADEEQQLAAIEKTRVTYVHDMQHLFYKITGCPLVLSWDTFAVKYDEMQEIETLDLTGDDGCGLAIYDNASIIVVAITDKVLDKFFWMSEFISRGELLGRLMYEDYEFVRLTCPMAIQKEYKNVSVTRNGNTITRKVKYINVSPPLSTEMPIPQSINYIHIYIEEEQTKEERKKEWAKLDFIDDRTKEIRDTESKQHKERLN